MPTMVDVDAAAVRAALMSQGARLTDLLRSVGDGSVPALGSWDLTDVAAHVSHTLDAVKAMVRGAGSVLDDIWDLSTLSAVLVEGEGTRSLSGIADRIDATVGELVVVADAADGRGVRPWVVGGAELPLASLMCQALNELMVHGRDIARAAGRPWPIDRAHAVLVLEGFLFPALDVLGRAMVDQKAAAGVKACFDVRLRGGGSTAMCFADGDLSVERSSSAPVDCHLSVDPAAFLLVAWGRASQWPAIARGQLLAWGRRPWLGLRLRALLRNP